MFILNKHHLVEYLNQVWIKHKWKLIIGWIKHR